ncbi:MAG: deoxyguanosinetriphosphate triphosphohydrolase [Acutalibacteraceae bacterium]|nr:deoxyguanosinetriphosphate triphosphohydrolase [Acutalibacteraceae bacterium]
MDIRKRTENWEKERLSQYAMLSSDSKGRKYDDDVCPVRTCFQRDRDRIIHCKAFRRLKHKTQVFLSPEGDYYRTRLTHTLEVSQIARTIAMALQLNEDLTEAVSLGHDLGHTPFGHAGERALDEVSQCGFKHYIQSVRVVEKLEKDGKGLNLTYEVLNGIERHTKGDWADTLEGRVVRYADRIAYINHDIDDAIRAGILKEQDIPKKFTDVLGNTTSQRINTLVKSMIDNSKDGSLKMADDIAQAYNGIHKFMYEYVYTNKYTRREEEKVPELVSKLYEYFKKHPEKMQPYIQPIIEAEGIDRAVCDHIASMSDQYAIKFYSELVVPKKWQF